MKFKYSAHLDKIENCPNSECMHRNLYAYRWGHDNFSGKDFEPLSLETPPAQRILDNSDKHCMSYGLSFFEKEQQARDKFMKGYNVAKAHLKQGYIQKRGDKIAVVLITEDDGVCSKSDLSGHFTLYEYININFDKRIENIFDIFQ